MQHPARIIPFSPLRVRGTILLFRAAVTVAAVFQGFSDGGAHFFFFQFDPGGANVGGGAISASGERFRRFPPSLPGDLDGRGSSSPVLQRLRQNQYLARLAHFSGPSRRRLCARFLTAVAAVT
jgi:hypothetical protein